MVSINLKQLALFALGMLTVNCGPFPNDKNGIGKRDSPGYIQQKFHSSKGEMGPNSPIGELEIGTRGQKIEILLDTGSWAAYIVAKNDSCKSSQSETSGITCDLHLNASSSSTFNETNERRVAGWGTPLGNFNGNWSSDAAQWKGVDFNFNFVYSTLGEAFPIVGLDLSGDDKDRYLLQDMQNSGAIQAKTFSLYYDDPDNFTGTLYFGAIDHSKYIGDLVEFEYDSQFDIGNYSLLFGNDTSKEILLSSESRSTMFDSGGINFSLQENAYKALFEKLGADVNGRVSCSKVKELDPIVEVTVNGKAKVQYPLKDNLPDGCETTDSFTSLKSSSSGPQGPGLWRYSYVVWDYEHKKMLIGKRNPDPGNSNIEVIRP